jgi:ferredoxin
MLRVLGVGFMGTRPSFPFLHTLITGRWSLRRKFVSNCQKCDACRTVCRTSRRVRVAERAIDTRPVQFLTKEIHYELLHRRAARRPLLARPDERLIAALRRRCSQAHCHGHPCPDRAPAAERRLVSRRPPSLQRDNDGGWSKNYRLERCGPRARRPRPCAVPRHAVGGRRSAFLGNCHARWANDQEESSFDNKRSRTRDRRQRWPQFRPTLEWRFPDDGRVAGLSSTNDWH